MSEKHKLLLFCAALFIGAQVILFQHYQLGALRQELRLAHKSKEIESDQSADLAQALLRLQTEKEISDVKQFVAGVAAAVRTPDRYTEVWHDGYDRGVAVQQAANQLDVKTRVTAETK